MAGEGELVNDLVMLSNQSLEYNCKLRGEIAKPEGFCSAIWDQVLCWPYTPPGTTAVLKCFEELQGVKYDSSQNATRFCSENGEWDNYTDYSRCEEKTHPTIVGPSTELTSHLYLAGYSLSLAALLLAVTIFVYFKDLRCLRNTIHTNLMCTYILFSFLWILNLTIQLVVEREDVSCLILTVFVQYFYLTNFFWMLVEGLYLYMLVVETFTGENIKLRVYATIGWGAPAIFITIWTVARIFIPSDPDAPELHEFGGLSMVCVWMRENPCDWIYKGAAMAGLSLNLLFLVRIMWVLITKLRSANTLETQQYRKATKALLVLIPLLGITNLLVFYGPTSGYISEIFDYTRAVLLSTQGFTVALFYCFLNTEVQNTMRHHIERWKAKRSVGGGRRYNYNYTKDWSPRSRTESIRLSF
ncbi:diuretic hormone 44 receptor 2 isoform X2 [Arctopsyche grandis]|uniref:diuretic hormone 44 receptor 2 isoform X2 n=1 Tax=Arctopsyche grandis TaxID=121162 RepID=UPI00406D9798